MARIPVKLMLKAYRRHRLLPLLLQECRSIDSAWAELRWLRERVISRSSNKDLVSKCADLRSMCRSRSKGMPLQYILGDQPFGDLEILCKSGVLIPRPETEAYTLYAAQLIAKYILSGSVPSSTLTRPLRILDFCTGTGCISLLLHALLSRHFRQLLILGVDVSAAAIELAKENIKHNLRLGLLSDRSLSQVHFRLGNVLGNDIAGIPKVEEILGDYVFPGSQRQNSELHMSGWDVLISNPPYVSSTSFWDGTTARSVRKFEPRLALIPPAYMDDNAATCVQEDVFYHRLVELSLKLSIKLIVLECGNRQQSDRVREFFLENLDRVHGWSIDIWPDVEIGFRNGEPDKDAACAIFLRKHPTSRACT